MFLYIWRHVQNSMQEGVKGAAGGSNSGGSNKAGLMRGGQLLNERFIAAWQKDGYRDYLEQVCMCVCVCVCVCICVCVSVYI